ncbi:hypothetical protein A0H81_03947 [Grifola frondosa]|uniref:Uncharacterized protein n=1 Tax=Grifola frondosa TaxID=5627 RepID=A0A1C7MIP6_GRIFR|nr:hypothetical protein A0H81_03947 [Grifola frondosa]
MHKSIITTAAPADDLWAKAGLLSPEVKRREVEQSDKVKTISATPHAKRIYGDIIMEKASATPKARTFRLLDRPSNMMMVGVSPIRSPIGKAEREARRRAMAEEADDFDDDEDM